MTTPSSKPICVTGANAFIGGHIVEQLLQKGHTVHGTVREPDAAKNTFLKDLGKKFAAAGGKLVLFKADLDTEGSFDAAVEGCDVVIHVAAVVTMNYKKDPFAEVINPTTNGVRNIAAACNRANVKRLVYTSSTSTLPMSEKLRPKAQRGKPYTDDMWATHYTPTFGTYNYSKIQAEKVLNELWKGELVSFLPTVVIGPQQNDQVTSSMQLVRALVNREYPICPPLYYDFVDVRDVAAAHVYAAEHREMPSGRYNVSSGIMRTVGDLGRGLNKAVPGLKAPTWMMNWYLFWLVTWFDTRIGTQMLYEVGTWYAAPTSQKLKDAGFSFQHEDFTTTLKDCHVSMIRHGISK